MSLLCAPLWPKIARAEQTNPANPSSLEEAKRDDFLRLIDRPRVRPDAVETPMPAPAPDLVESHLLFTSEPGQRVPALIVRLASLPHAPAPVMIILHGTGQRKEDEKDLLEMFARAGMIAIAPDGRFHGERSPYGHGTKAYYAAIDRAYADGRSHPWLYDTVYDVMRLMDYLQTRPDVDGRRIGIMGISKGGMECYLTAAVDPRVAVAIPCICFQSFRWELDHGQWHGRIGTVGGAFDVAAAQSGASPDDPAFVQRFYDRIVPGIAGPFDCPAMVALIAPRPMLAISGEKDPINPLPSALIAVDAARKAYDRDAAADRFKFILENGLGHVVTRTAKEAAVAWATRWLRAQPPVTGAAAAGSPGNAAR